MTVQKVIIHLTDENSNEIGILSIVSPLDYESKENFTNEISSLITLENIPSVDKPDNITPIQYWENNPSNFAKLMFLEETEYHVLFESDDVNSNYNVLHSLTKMNNDHFKPFKFSLGDDNEYKIAGTLNFRSYVGKSFLDVMKNNIGSNKVPIEVRSKKIDYFSQYSAMIADLSQHALSLIFEVTSPLYQEFKLSSRQKETYYEDFMFLEYLFRPENLPSIFEYLSKNLHSQLRENVETVPVSFASNVNQNTLKNIASKPNKLSKSDSNFEIVKRLNGYVPYEIEQTKHEDVIDTPENRFFKYFLELIQELIEKLINAADGFINDELLLFRDEIGYFLSNKFFNHISAMDYVPFNSQILQKKEGYREIFHYFLMLEFSFRLSWDEVNSQFKGFEKKLSELYEYWCYFKILKVLNDLSVEKVNFDDIFTINKDQWSISIKKGKKSAKPFKILLNGTEIDVELFYNLNFSKNSKNYKSYSLIFQPDYTLKVSVDNHINFIHFDAKYRSELEITDYYDKINGIEDINKRDNQEEFESKYKNGDIYKMHTYKDSILKSHGAYVLYPGSVSNRFKVVDYQEIPSVGAFSLTPGHDEYDEEELSNFIINILKIISFKNGSYIWEFYSSFY